MQSTGAQGAASDEVADVSGSKGIETAVPRVHEMEWTQQQQLQRQACAHLGEGAAPFEPSVFLTGGRSEEMEADEETDDQLCPEPVPG